MKTILIIFRYVKRGFDSLNFIKKESNGKNKMVMRPNNVIWIDRGSC
jgi:hypothetical protein